MYVVIGGGGKVGQHIAQDLRQRDNRVTIIESAADRCEHLVAETPVLVIEGDASDVRFLEQARVDRADAFVATTREDEDNLVACQLARIEFGVPRVISRVSTPKNVEIFERLGIEAVSSTRLIAQLLEQEFTVGDLVHLTTLKGGRVNIVEVVIPGPEDGPVPVRRVSDLGLPYEAVLVALFRGEETVIPRGDTEILPGDEVVALTTPQVETKLRAALVGP